MKRYTYITLLFLLVFGSLSGQNWPRFFWTQIERADSVGNIAIAGPDSSGVWSDSLRFWQGKLRIGVDTAATLEDVRNNAIENNTSNNYLPYWDGNRWGS